jgi:C4-dicarboxylate-specific signal transduction histidine kinase
MFNRDTAFMGRMTAGVTHELKNVLAIIKESAGLIEDILAMNKGAGLAHEDRVVRVLSNIRQQVDRGVDLSSRLNAFAHSPDEISAGVDLNTVVDLVVSLCQRFARLKAVVLVAKTQPQEVILVTDPLKLQMLLVGAIDLLLQVVPSGSTMSLEPSDRGAGTVAVVFSSNGEERQRTAQQQLDPTACADWPSLSESCAELNGTLEAGPAPAWCTMIFR